MEEACVHEHHHDPPPPSPTYKAEKAVEPGFTETSCLKVLSAPNAAD